MTPEQVAAIERLKTMAVKADKITDTEIYFNQSSLIEFISNYRKEALPLLEALQAENERLRAGIGRAVSDLSDWYEFDDSSKSIFEIKLALEALHDA